MAYATWQALAHVVLAHIGLLSRLDLGIADGMSILRVWACRYSK